MRTFADITIDELIRQGKAVLEQSDYEEALDSYTVWKSRIQTYAIKNGFSRELQNQLKVRAHFVRNVLFQNLYPGRQKSKMNMISSTSCMHCCAQYFRKPAKK